MLLIKEDEEVRRRRYRNVFMIVFNGSMEYRVYACAASLVGKERSNGKVEKVFLQLNVWTKGVLLF